MTPQTKVNEVSTIKPVVKLGSSGSKQSKNACLVQLWTSIRNLTALVVPGGDHQSENKVDIWEYVKV